MDCPVCYENMQNNLLLSCGHHICLSCYLKILQTNNIFKCCLCRKIIHEYINFLPIDNNKIEASYSLNENTIYIYYDNNEINIMKYKLNEYCKLCIKMKNNKRNYNFYKMMCQQIMNHFKTYKTIDELKNINYFKIAYIYKNFKCALEYNNDILNIYLHNKNCQNVY